MDPVLAKQILAQIAAEHLSQRVTFHVLGEPLLHPRFCEILAYTKSVQLRSIVNTNGSRLSSDIVDCMLKNADAILISFRSTDQEAFQRISGAHQSDSYAIYVDGIDRLIARKLSLNSAAKIYLRLFDLSRGVSLPHELVQSHEFVAKLDRVLQQKSSPTYGKVGSINPVEIYRGVYVVFDRLQEFWFRAHTNRFYKGFWGKCDALDRQLAILYNGDCTTCCYDYDGVNTIGNVVDMSISEVLNGERARWFRAKFGRMILPTQLCQECFGASSVGLWVLRNLYVLGQFVGLVPPKSFV